MKPLLIFDYDGTIHNTMGIYEPAFRKTQAMLEEEGLLSHEDVSYDRISGWLGMNSVDMWNDFAPDLSEDVKKRASESVMNMMSFDILEGKASWYEGASGQLDMLKAEGYTLVILSNCRISYRDAHWKTFEMDKWFDRFYDCESFGFKPKTEIVRTILEEYPGECIVIGDRKSDLECAVSCGGRFVACLYGYGRDGELDGSDEYAYSVSDIAGCIARIVQRDEDTRLGNPRKPTGSSGVKMLERMNESHSALTDWGLSFVKMDKTADVLDIGCGGGMTLKKLSEMTEGRVVGIDYSCDSVMKSRETVCGKAEVFECSVESMPFMDNSFDRIVTVESFYFWPDPAENLKEVFRVLRPGGVFQIISDTYDNGRLSEAARKNVQKYNLFVPGPEKLMEMLDDAGFTDNRIHLKDGTSWICSESGKK